MIPADLKRQSPGHYASVSGRGRVVKLPDGERWQGIKPTGERSPVFGTLTEAYDWLPATPEPATT
jgi:hypothetical protein